VERVVYLTDDERRRLLAAYNPHAACPVLVLAYQGFRTQEALRMDWRWVSFRRPTIAIPASGTKTGTGRTVPMHPRVEALLFGMWCAAGKPDSGTVFLSVRGEPYADTRGRDGGRQGGNPLTQAHETACKRAGITGFRVHDWRHDFATRWLMSGGDILTLQRICGWSSPRMVQRYATTTADHMAKSLRQIA
jgi:integrase